MDELSRQLRNLTLKYDNLLSLVKDKNQTHFVHLAPIEEEREEELQEEREAFASKAEEVYVLGRRGADAMDQDEDETEVRRYQRRPRVEARQPVERQQQEAGVGPAAGRGATRAPRATGVAAGTQDMMAKMKINVPVEALLNMDQ